MRGSGSGGTVGNRWEIYFFVKKGEENNIPPPQARKEIRKKCACYFCPSEVLNNSQLAPSFAQCAASVAAAFQSDYCSARTAAGLSECYEHQRYHNLTAGRGVEQRYSDIQTTCKLNISCTGKCWRIAAARNDITVKWLTVAQVGSEDRSSLLTNLARYVVPDYKSIAA